MVGKKVLSVVVMFLLFSILTSQSVFSLEAVRTYVHDEANVISQNYEDYLFYELELLRENTSVEMAVVTVDSLNGVPIEEYSLNLAHKQLGDKNKDNGILILLAVKDRQYRIEVGYGLEGVINAPLAGRIGREYMEPQFVNNNFEQGLLDGVIVIRDVLENDDSWETQANANAIKKQNDEAKIKLLLIVFAILFWLLLSYINFKAINHKKRKSHDDSKLQTAAFLIWLMNRGGKGGGNFGGGSFGGGASFGGGSFGGGGFSGKF